MTWNDVAQAKYALLTTYKKDGSPVSTPVWIAPDGDRIVVWTTPDTGKVKRIRRNPRIALQPCDGRGKPRSDEIITGLARILDAAGTEEVRAAVSRKYRYAGALAIKVHKAFRGADASIGVAVTPNASEG
ncbi:PPOX class F420-dependent oxidoreductase [Nocardia seriolae]|nr:PPOX class F420-dependent oxidoreductase [Nocardia seriolae]MTJ62281.1 PPOX class F420-dependent oxidoreductase [Nocardia seriolae]MTJ70796.1 PPOX class F420-dependent oxidoreductase [Nocardia seriolae]MTJ87187.1 PPOX class F420-dependent oxidoreductase [Nocardia seriolae]MTK31181.1 PPOX class F420-dependent oxidoreductase [Nocardia seriolae]MTK40232.1 PPOX class F420-dependent oxidoreductase [Nocardia seriolae]